MAEAFIGSAWTGTRNTMTATGTATNCQQKPAKPEESDIVTCARRNGSLQAAYERFPPPRADPDTKVS
ncbi:hypothetical protein [Gluconobacter oxydans]|uniref:hypothetical protein n=1 Tax=Gluconobacter oxydans TaxID=442 RepID=UPI001558E601|nr:hypothetical protein [Gluconobacter oxydans]